MPGYRAEENLAYFCTITVVEWLPVLIEQRYKDPIIDTLRFCREQKDLQVFAFLVMPNHVLCGAPHNTSISSPPQGRIWNP